MIGTRTAGAPALIASLALAAMALAGCAGGAPSESEPGAASAPPISGELGNAEPDAAVETDESQAPSPEASEAAEPEVSDYADCPSGLTDRQNELSSGGSEWQLGVWSQTAIGQQVEVPVPSCTTVRGTDWTAAYWVGGDAALADELGAAIEALGVPVDESRAPAPGTQTWGSGETGFITVTMLTPGDMSSFLSDAFSEPTIELEVLGQPLG